MRDLYIGVDGGTGDMESVVVDVTGAIRGRGSAGPSNDPAMVGRMHPRVGSHVVGAVQEALAAAGASPRHVQAISLNLSGDPSRLKRAQAREWLSPLELSRETLIAIDQDGLSAWAAGGLPATLFEVFRSFLHAALPGVSIRENEISQAEGAALLAMRHAGLMVGPEIFAQL